MFIVFEGIDRCGKSTLSVLFQEYLNNRYRGDDGLLLIDPSFGDFVWTKEPTFTTEEADNLNSPEFTNEYKRELLFYISRTRHQEFISGKNVVCDRYIWTGLTYAKLFSPDCYGFAKELYLSDELFLKPDIQVFVDTPVDVCMERAKKLGEPINRSTLESLRENYLTTKQFFVNPIITIESIKKPEEVLEELVEKIEPFFNLSYTGC